MKKLNNKGFAISTVIYGLSIMGIMLVAILMATMASTRSNSRQLAKSIEEELNRFSKTETSFSSHVASGSASFPTSQEYIVPTSGWYKIELWGSSGAGTGSYGAYTTGIIELEEGEVLYFYAGAAKTGREADVRIVSGNYNDDYSVSSRIMVAAGGGSGYGAAGGTLVGYSSSMNSRGGYINSWKSKDFSLLPSNDPNNRYATNGTLVGYPYGYSESSLKQPTVGSSMTPIVTYHPNSTTGGGDGYYPSNNANIGGISYIAGYGGSYALVAGRVSSSPKANIYEQTYDMTTDDGGGAIYGASKGEYYFVDAMMLPGVNDGAGKARIERMVLKTETGKLTRKNTKLDKVRYIKDCVGLANTSQTINFKRFAAIAEGNDIIQERGLAFSTPVNGDNGTKCATVDLKTKYTLDEIVVFHDSGKDYLYHTLQVSETGANGSWVDLIGSTYGSEYSVSESVTGLRVSAYQFDSTAELPAKGNYYIMPVLSENKVVTKLSIKDVAHTEEDKEGDIIAPLAIKEMNGYKRQRWAIESIGNGEYKIYELSKYNAMTILQDENIVGNTIGADSTFNTYTRDETQIWKIQALGNGTYTISTILDSVDYENEDNGNITVQSNPKNSENYNSIIIGKNNMVTTRFRFISVDYSSS